MGSYKTLSIKNLTGQQNDISTCDLHLHHIRVVVLEFLVEVKKELIVVMTEAILDESTWSSGIPSTIAGRVSGQYF